MSRCCRDCRHWGEPAPQRQKDGSFQPGHWHECQRLWVVTEHTWGDYMKAGRHFDKGDVVTEEQVRRFDLAVDRLHTDAQFVCSGWKPANAGPETDDWWKEAA